MITLARMSTLRKQDVACLVHHTAPGASDLRHAEPDHHEHLGIVWMQILML